MLEIRRSMDKSVVLASLTASWTAYQDTRKIAESVNRITEAITQAASQTIPVTSGTTTRPKVPWWISDIANNIKQQRSALKRFRRNPTIQNMINFKKARAKARRTIMSSKKSSFQHFVSTITPETTTKEIWDKIRAISGKRFPIEMPILLISTRKVLLFATLVLATIALFFQTATACLADGEACVYDPTGQTFADCCSGFCYQQVGWAEGYCKTQ
nr:unnamed protein product [Callosobruchus analis]